MSFYSVGFPDVESRKKSLPRTTAGASCGLMMVDMGKLSSVALLFAMRIGRPAGPASMPSFTVFMELPAKQHCSRCSRDWSRLPKMSVYVCLA